MILFLWYCDIFEKRVIFLERKLLTAERFVDMRIECSYRYVLSTTEYFRPHYHDYYELFVMLDGNALHCVNGEQINLKKGDMVFIRPKDTHDYLCRNGKVFSMMNITFTQKTADELFGFLGEGFNSDALKTKPLPPTVHLNESELDWFNSRMDSVCAIDGNDLKNIKTALRILLFRIFTRFFSDFGEQDDAMPLWLDELLDEMRQNGNFIVGVDRLLELSPKTREHTLRCIKKYTDHTATEFINGLRLNFIANMLRNSNHSVSDIIYESGFNNISWASAQFREKFGVTMREYRNAK